jgi:hypothetical protein
MIISAELEKIPLFAGVEEQERRRLARRAADISLEPGEGLIVKVNSKPSKTSSASARCWVAV